jgi:hypothetical protein
VNDALSLCLYMHAPDPILFSLSAESYNYGGAGAVGRIKPNGNGVLLLNKILEIR